MNLTIGTVIGMVRLRTSIILSRQSWEIGSPPTGGAGWMKLSCPDGSYTSDAFIHLEEGNILVECNNFAGKKGQIYFVREVSWNHLNSSPQTCYFI